MAGDTQPGGKVTERDWVLGDADVARLWREFLVTATLWPHNASNTPWDFARAVERAVLAKVNPPCADCDRPSLCAVIRAGTQPCRHGVTEREARKRELMARREGYERALDEIGRRGRDAIDIISATQAFPDTPLPTKRVPRTVVLSDGVRVRKNVAGEGWDHFHDGTRMLRFLTLGDLFSLAGTVADARLLSDLVERPYDEVPDDD